MNVEEACRIGLHKSAIDQNTHEEVIEGVWNIGSIWLSVEVAREDRGSYFAT